MRLLVMSDMHGRKNYFEKAIDSQPEAKNIIFLGDGATAAAGLSEFYPDRNFYIVEGNCDFSTEFPTTRYLEFEGKKILITHGHTFGVKFGTGNLLEGAKQSGVDIALYGHTHIANIDYHNGIYLVNPGSLCGMPTPASYATIDIVSGGIFPNIVKI